MIMCILVYHSRILVNKYPTLACPEITYMHVYLDEVLGQGQELRVRGGTPAPPFAPLAPKPHVHLSDPLYIKDMAVLYLFPLW